MATRVRLHRARIVTDATVAAPPMSGGGGMAVPAVATPPGGVTVRLHRAQILDVVHTSGVTVRLHRAQIQADEVNVAGTVVRLRRAQIVTSVSGLTPVPTSVVATPPSAEPGQRVLLTATGTPGAAYTFAMQPGWAGTLQQLTIGGSLCWLTPALNEQLGYAEANVQVVAHYTGLPDSAAIITVRVFPVFARMRLGNASIPLVAFQV